MLTDDDALDAVASDVLAGARPGTTLVDMSTVSVAASERIAERASDAGVAFLRSPVSGNPTVVRGGTLTLVVSGPEDAAQRLDPLLRAVGPKVFYVGEGERARVVKLALQVLVGGITELLGEAVVLGESAGVDRAKLLEVINASAVGSALTGYKGDALVRDDYSATFTTAMMLKDVDLVLDLAEQNRARAPVQPPPAPTARARHRGRARGRGLPRAVPQPPRFHRDREGDRMTNIASLGATMAVDWEQRIDFARLRADRLARARRMLDASDLGALLLFDPNNIRYVTSTHIGEWARDKNARWVLLLPRRRSDPVGLRLGRAPSPAVRAVACAGELPRRCGADARRDAGRDGRAGPPRRQDRRRAPRARPAR